MHVIDIRYQSTSSMELGCSCAEWDVSGINDLPHATDIFRNRLIKNEFSTLFTTPEPLREPVSEGSKVKRCVQGGRGEYQVQDLVCTHGYTWVADIWNTYHPFCHKTISVACYQLNKSLNLLELTRVQANCFFCKAGSWLALYFVLPILFNLRSWHFQLCHRENSGHWEVWICRSRLVSVDPIDALVARVQHTCCDPSLSEQEGRSRWWRSIRACVATPHC